MHAFCLLSLVCSRSSLCVWVPVRGSVEEDVDLAVPPLGVLDAVHGRVRRLLGQPEQVVAEDTQVDALMVGRPGTCRN